MVSAMNGEMTRVDSFRDLRNTWWSSAHLIGSLKNFHDTDWFLRVLLGIPWHSISFVGSTDHWTGHRSLNHMAVLKSSQKLVGKCGSEKSNDVSPCAVDIYVGHHRGQYRREWKRLLLILLQSLESWACLFGVIWSLFQVVRQFLGDERSNPKQSVEKV